MSDTIPTNTSIIKPQTPATVQVKPIRRVRRVGDITNFDGEYYRIYRITHKKDVVLRPLKPHEVKSYLDKQRREGVK